MCTGRLTRVELCCQSCLWSFLNFLGLSPLPGIEPFLANGDVILRTKHTWCCSSAQAAATVSKKVEKKTNTEVSNVRKVGTWIHTIYIYISQYFNFSGFVRFSEHTNWNLTRIFLPQIYFFSMTVGKSLVLALKFERDHTNLLWGLNFQHKNTIGKIPQLHFWFHGI